MTTLICIYCGKKQRFMGDPDLVIKKINAAGWGGCDDICPACDGERSEEGGYTRDMGGRLPMAGDFKR